ncbi:MAG: radical SAM protein [Thermodesulfobacteriota bacterium]
MNYQGDVIRPPSEADSIIIQATVGCSHNSCTFCGAYKNKVFRIRDVAEVEENIDLCNRYQPEAKTVFLADGDALILSQKRLTSLLTLIRERLPRIRRISVYANAKAIRNKSVRDLADLRSLGLGRIYMGLESGDGEVLASVKKGETPESMLAAATRVREAGIFFSVTVLLGLAGDSGSTDHAIKTGLLLSEMAPNQIAALTLMPIPSTPLSDDIQRGIFTLPDANSMLRELRTMLEYIHCDRTQFMANHASNYLPLQGRLQRDRDKLIHTIDQALDGKRTLSPEFTRGL